MHVLDILNRAGSGGGRYSLTAAPGRSGRIVVRYTTPTTGGTLTCRPDLRVAVRLLREAGYWGWLSIPMNSGDWSRSRAGGEA